MKFKVKANIVFWAVFGVAIAISLLAFKAVLSRLPSVIRHSHTEFLFGQIRQEISLPPEISSLAELAGHLSGAALDWNSCTLTERGILDGWEQEIRFSVLDNGGFELQSSGADGIFDTDDDIETEIPPNSALRSLQPTR